MSTEVFDVLVIGAGVAGITASHLLSRVGLKIQILEASDRSGGRIKTVKDHFLLQTDSPDFEKPTIPVDLGASWIHGVAGGNPIWDLAMVGNVPVCKTLWSRTLLFEQNGKEVPDLVSSDLLFEVMDELAYHGNLLKSTESVEEFIDKFCQNYKNDKISKELLRSLANLCAVWEIEWEWANMASQIDAQQAYFDNEAIVGAHVTMNTGYWTIFENSILPTVSNFIQYNSVVKSISLLKDGRDISEIRTTDDRTFYAKHVICTVPLGVLKKKLISFSPELSKNKLDSIERVGFGALNKVYIQFPFDFWQKKAEKNGLPPPHLIALSSSKIDGCLTIAMNHNILYPGSNILGFIYVGSCVEELEQATDQHILDLALKNLITMFGENEVPNPINYLITRWGREEHYYGSYSSPVIGSTPSDVVELGTHEGNIHFAGEHTHYDLRGSVTGAYYSGKRVANEIFDILKIPYSLQETPTNIATGIYLIDDEESDESDD